MYGANTAEMGLDFSLPIASLALVRARICHNRFKHITGHAPTPSILGELAVDKPLQIDLCKNGRNVLCGDVC
jgi:hypothetical protein